VPQSPRCETLEGTTAAEAVGFEAILVVEMGGIAVEEAEEIGDVAFASVSKVDVAITPTAWLEFKSKSREVDADASVLSKGGID